MTSIKKFLQAIVANADREGWGDEFVSPVANTVTIGDARAALAKTIIDLDTTDPGPTAVLHVDSDERDDVDE